MGKEPAPGAAESMQPVVYRRRRNRFSRGERAWRVDEDALVTVGSSGAERRFAWRDMRRVRLCFQPARFRPWRYVFELQPRQGGKLVLDNAHYLARACYEDRSEAYRAFVEAALERLQDANPDLRVLIGETPLRYFLLLLAALLGLGGIAFALIAVPTPFDALPYAPLVKLALVLAMLPIFGRWVLGAVPRGVSPTEVPARALPFAGAGPPNV
jgi:hypothetical protein